MSDICTDVVTCENKEQWDVEAIIKSVIYTDGDGCYWLNTIQCCGEEEPL